MFARTSELERPVNRPMASELEKHVNAPGRADKVKEVRQKINDLGITYIYYQFISVTGRIVGKGIPAAHWERTAEKGFQLVYGSTANLFLDRHGQYIGYGPEASELIGIPDPETFVQLPWDKRIARVFCTCFRNREEESDGGSHLPSDCRGNLAIHHAEFQKKHNMHMRIGCEPEMMWLRRDEAGNLGDSMYDGTIYVGGSIASLGVDAVEAEMTDLDVAWLERKLSAYEIEPKKDLHKMTKIVAGKQLWNYDTLEPAEKKLVL